ncbi:SDR family NAD(P)-dependent oxidoreductase [Paenibacillus turpanensis]|uniref:SDR family NAD(P)-dependent oxidoreductase n=1 Tax=Paenibacillus turpanensis TaxID=2689078 RepID=UPI00140BC18D|nr:SDR family NAD(P)-dependent oxidoreductase [Paenibacillus turpanensis]
MDIRGKIVVVTGAAGGIGAAAVKRFASEGAVVIATGRTEAKLAPLVGTAAEAVVLDVTSDEEVQNVISRIEHTYGRIDVLVNNAGYGIFESVLEGTIENFESMMNVNYLGTVRCTKAVMEGMMSRGSGHIVNVASLAGKVATSKSSGYSATKHAVLGFTNALRQESVPFGIRVTAINPGPVDTGFFGIADPSGQYAKRMRRMMITPELVASRIVRAVRTGSREENIPGFLGAGAVLYNMFPAMIDRLGGKLFNQK